MRVSEEEKSDRGGDRYPANVLNALQEQRDPVAYAHCAGVSLVLTCIVAFFLAATIAVVSLVGNSPDFGTVLLFVVCYFVFFLGGGLFGLPRPAIPCIEPLAAMRAFTIWRVVLVVAFVVAGWVEPWGAGVGEAALWACLLLGAIVDGVCLNRVALAWKVGFGGAAAISLRAALPLKSGGPPPLPVGDGR